MQAVCAASGLRQVKIQLTILVWCSSYSLIRLVEACICTDRLIISLQRLIPHSNELQYIVYASEYVHTAPLPDSNACHRFNAGVNLQ